MKNKTNLLKNYKRKCTQRFSDNIFCVTLKRFLQKKDFCDKKMCDKKYCEKKFLGQ
jgi:hypothetical protein